MEDNAVADSGKVYSKGYRHRTVSRFMVQGHVKKENAVTGKTQLIPEYFEFKNNVLVIYGNSQAELDEKVNCFLDAAKNLELRDRNAIVEMAVVDNETPIAESISRRIAGPTSTADIKAPVRSQNEGGLGLRLTPSA